MRHSVENSRACEERKIPLYVAQRLVRFCVGMGPDNSFALPQVVAASMRVGGMECRVWCTSRKRLLISRAIEEEQCALCNRV